MAKVELRGVCKVYDGGVKAVEHADITIEDREFVVLVGPSGCGKSTTLRMIAGLEEISSGELSIDGKVMNEVPPKDRDIAMVFQNYALYPHMSVYENMAFGLKIRKLPKAEIDRRVREAARVLDIETLLERAPKALSGGQRQRVAVGRAIVRDPKVFLFDEPLSNLDANLRVQMRAEIVELHRRLDATMIYVTHDQVEAMTMGDRIVVMREGTVQQAGSPLSLYNEPANKFVAGFIGSPPMNFLSARLVQADGGLLVDEGSFRLPVARAHAGPLMPFRDRELCFGIRPEDLRLAKPGEAGSFKARVSFVEPLGAEINLYAATAANSLVARARPGHVFKAGDIVELSPDMERARYFNPETEESILPAEEERSSSR